jgi:hypothetical protein
LNFFINQIKYEEVGISIGGLLVISLESTLKSVGILGSAFLLILDLKDKV